MLNLSPLFYRVRISHYGHAPKEPLSMDAGVGIRRLTGRLFHDSAPTGNKIARAHYFTRRAQLRKMATIMHHNIIVAPRAVVLPTPSLSALTASYTIRSDFAPPFQHKNLTTLSSKDYFRRFPNEYYQPYTRVVTKILSSKEYMSKKEILMGEGRWSANAIRRFEKWLLQTRPAVEEQITLERWSCIRDKWIIIMANNLDKNKDANNTDERRGPRLQQQQQQQEESALFDLTSQREALESKIMTTSPSSSIEQHVFHKLIDYCIVGANSQGPILPVVWYKIKECGAMLQRSKLRALLNSMVQPTTHAPYNQVVEQSTKQMTLLEEIIMYHDVLSWEVNEKSFYERYPAMLRYHCKMGDADSALALMSSMQPLPLTPFEYDHYMFVLVTLAENGHFRGGGIKLLDRIAANMASQACDISPSSAIRLYNALAVESDMLYPPTNNNESTAISELKECSPSDSIPVRDLPAKENEILACRVEIDPSTWICPVTNTQLLSYSMTPAKRKQMHEDIIGLRQEQTKLADELKKFSDWLRDRDGPPFTAIIDGANVKHLGWMMARLEEKGEYPLVVLLQTAGIDKKVVKRLEEEGKIYIVAGKFHDDYFSMIATVSDQKGSCSLNTNNPQQKIQPVLITNDLFRDHSRKMQDPEWFSEWYRIYCYSHTYSSGKVKRLPPISSRNIAHNAKDNAQSELAFSTEHQRQRIYNDIVALAQKRSAVVEDLGRFSNWMNERNGNPFTVVLDGANIGLNTEAMVASLEGKGEYPLVLFPELAALDALPIVERLRNKGILYVIPDDPDDSLFHMIATVSDQRVSCSNYFANDHAQVHTVLITNTSFDDLHKMRHPSLASEWYIRHCHEHCPQSGKVKSLPRVLNRRIEQNDWPNANDGNESSSNWTGGKVWHFLVSGWDFHERFVIRLPTKYKNDT